MRPLTYVPRYTVKDYNMWEGDWELIDGIPYAMSPAPVRKHQRLATELLYRAVDELKKNTEKCKSCEAVFELDWIMDDSTVLRPDIAVICQKAGDFITTPPVLIIEILSVSSALKDRQVKFEIYQEHGVQYYILADPELKTFQIFQLISGKYHEKNTLKSFSIHADCAINLDISAAWHVLA